MSVGAPPPSGGATPVLRADYVLNFQDNGLSRAVQLDNTLRGNLTKTSSSLLAAGRVGSAANAQIASSSAKMAAQVKADAAKNDDAWRLASRTAMQATRNVARAHAQMADQIDKETTEIVETLRKQGHSYNEIVGAARKLSTAQRDGVKANQEFRVSADQLQAAVLRGSREEIEAINKQVAARNKLRGLVGLRQTETGRSGGIPLEREEKSFVRGAASSVAGAGRGGLGYIGGGLAGGLAGYFSGAGIEDAIKQTTELADQTQYLSQVTGIDEKRAAAWIAIAKSRGVSANTLSEAIHNLGDTADKSLEKVGGDKVKRNFDTLASKTQAAVEGSAAAQKQFVQAGISAEDVAKHQHDLPGLYAEIAGNLDKLGNGYEKTALTNELLGHQSSATAKTITEQRKAYADLGISQSQIRKDSHDTAALFELVSERLDKMRPGIQKTRIENELFGRSYNGLSQILEGGAKGLDDATKQAESYGITLSGGPRKQAEELEAAQQKLSLQTLALQVQFSEHFAPSILGAMNDALKYGQVLVQHVGPPLKTVAGDIKDVVHWFDEHRTALHALLITAGSVGALVVLSKTLQRVGDISRGLATDWRALKAGYRAVADLLGGNAQTIIDKFKHQETESEKLQTETRDLSAAMRQLAGSYDIAAGSASAFAKAQSEADIAERESSSPSMPFGGGSFSTATGSLGRRGATSFESEGEDVAKVETGTAAKTVEAEVEGASGGGIMQALLGKTASDGIVSKLGSLVGRAGGAGIGGMLGYQLGGMAGGFLGKTGSSYGKAIGAGAGAGLAFGPEGALAGAAGGAAFEGLKKLFDRPSSQQKAISDLTQQAQRALSTRNIAGLYQDSREASARAQQFRREESGAGTRTLAPGSGRFGAAYYMQKPPDLSKQIKQADDLADATQRYARAAQDAQTHDFAQSLADIKIPNVSGFMDQFVQQFSGRGSQIQDAASKTMLLYAQGLQDAGKLPKGSVDKLLDDLEARFPRLARYAKQQGLDTDAGLAGAFHMTKARASLSRTIQELQGQWGGMPKSATQTGAGVVAQFSGSMGRLQQVIANSTGKQRAAASTEWSGLRDDATTYFTAAEQTVASKQTAMTNDITSGSATAMNQANANWQQYQTNVYNAMNGGVISVQKGNALLVKELNTTLKAFGAKPLTATQQGIMQTNGARVAAGRMRGGGWVPGDPHRDGTMILASGDEFVMTGDGQRMMETFAPGLLDHIASQQMPHFANGGFVDQVKAPVIHASGTIMREGQAMLDREARAANGYLARIEAAADRANGSGGQGTLGSMKGPGESIMARFFRGKGLDTTAIAGIIGNSTQESGIRSSLTGASGLGFFQWIGGRRAAAQAMAQREHTSATNPNLQLQYAWHEMTSSYPGLVGELKGARSPAQAAQIFEQRFEAAGDPQMSNRIHYAQAAYQWLKHHGYRKGGFVGLPRFAGGGYVDNGLGWTSGHPPSSSSSNVPHRTLVPGTGGKGEPPPKYEMLTTQQAANLRWAYDNSKKSKTRLSQHVIPGTGGTTNVPPKYEMVSSKVYADQRYYYERHQRRIKQRQEAAIHAREHQKRFAWRQNQKGITGDPFLESMEYYSSQDDESTGVSLGTMLKQAIRGSQLHRVALPNLTSYQASAAVTGKKGRSGKVTGGGASFQGFVAPYPPLGAPGPRGVVPYTNPDGSRPGGTGEVAKWIVNELMFARKFGFRGNVTSGYRPGVDPHTASGQSNHQGTWFNNGQMPSGAIDFGGMYNDPAAKATKERLLAIAAAHKYPGLRLKMPIGFVDDGHVSGNGHRRGGFVGSRPRRFAVGGSLRARPTGSVASGLGAAPSTMAGVGSIGSTFAGGTLMANSPRPVYPAIDPMPQSLGLPVTSIDSVIAAGIAQSVGQAISMMETQAVTLAADGSRRQIAAATLSLRSEIRGVAQGGNNTQIKRTLTDLKNTLSNVDDVSYGRLLRTRDALKSQIKALQGVRPQRVDISPLSKHASRQQQAAHQEALSINHAASQISRQSGPDSSRRIVRLQQALKLTEGAMGMRVGLLIKAADDETNSIQDAQTALQNYMNRHNIQSDSVAGTKALERYQDSVVKTMRDTVEKLRTAYRAAVAADGANSKAANEIQGKLKTALQGLDQSLGDRVQARVARITAVAQQAVDQATHRTTLAQGRTTGLQNRISLADQYAGRAGMTANEGARVAASLGFRRTSTGRLAATGAGQASDIQGEIAALRKQQRAASRVGDKTLANQIGESIQEKQGEYQQAELDALNAIKQGVEDQAQAMTDAAQHSANMAAGATSNLQAMLQGTGGSNDQTQTVAGGQALASSYQTQASQQAGLIAALQNQQAAAISVGDPTLADQIAESIQSAQGQYQQDLLDATLAIKAGVEGQAQTMVDAANHGVNMAQGATSMLQAQLQGTGVNDLTQTTAGGQQLAASYQAQAQTISQQLAALQNQQAADLSVGDTDSATQVAEAIQSAQASYQQAELDALQAIREGVEGSAQSLVDIATHTVNMAQTGQQTIELQQQIAGTQDSAGAKAQIADYINQVVIPALQQSLKALQGQLAAANSVNDTQLATQIAEQIAGQQNSILQAQLDAQNEIKNNTAETAENTASFSGQLALSFEDETFSDLAGILNGA